MTSEEFKARQRANAKPDARANREARRRRKHARRGPKARRVTRVVMRAGRFGPIPVGREYVRP